MLAAFGTLYGCGSAPDKRNASNSTKVPIEDTTSTITTTVIDRIEADYARTADIDARNLALVELANSYVEEGNCKASDVILAHVHGSLNTSYSKSLASLLKLECQLAKHNELQSNSPIFTLLQQWSDDTSGMSTANFSTQLQSRAKVARATLFAKQNHYSLAIQSLYSGNSAQVWLSNPDYNNRVWQWFSLVAIKERRKLVSMYPALRDAFELLQLIEDDTLNDGVRQANIRQWLAQYPNANIAKLLPLQVSEYLSLGESTQKNTIVLLPLSGRLASQGEAIKQGILAAYLHKASQQNTQNNPAIEFYDTGSLNKLSENITPALLSEFDTLIGPLLKPHIEQLSQISLPSQKRVLLNQADTFSDDSDILHAFYALSPEQEAVQLARLMQREGLHKPVIIDDGSSIAKRMSLAFAGAWAQANERSGKVNMTEQTKPLQKISYTDNKSMRIGITAALDVLQSQRRIQQLSNLSGERVYSVTRNRRDLDAFVVFAKPDDLELVNPIIEASISLFTDEQIPVFASSYSYDHKQNKNTQRDLRNLVFIDMPWLLPSERSSALSQQVDLLFNQPPSAFLRLFAFGYDAFDVSENIAQLSTFKHMNINGLSGKLSIDENNSLLRQLDSLAITDAANGF